MWLPSQLGPRAEGRRTHGSDTQKRACSQHIYILCNIYRGVHRFVHESSAVSAPVLNRCCGPWMGVVVQRGKITRPLGVRSG